MVTLGCNAECNIQLPSGPDEVGRIDAVDGLHYFQPLMDNIWLCLEDIDTKMEVQNGMVLRFADVSSRSMNMWLENGEIVITLDDGRRVGHFDDSFDVGRT